MAQADVARSKDIIAVISGWVALAIFAAVAIVALTALLARRWHDAFAAPPPGAMPIAVAGGITLLVWTLHLLWRAVSPRDASPALHQLMRSALLVMLSLFGLALSMPDMRPVVLCGMWIVLAIGAAPLLWWIPPAPWPAAPVGGSRHLAVKSPNLAIWSTERSAAVEVEHPADTDEVAEEEQVVQRMTRTRDPQGTETIFGEVSVEFTAGQRIGAAHVAFCPPLPSPPELEIEQEAGPPARITLGQAYVYGARFDVKLSSGPANGAMVTIAFTAVARGEPEGSAKP